MRGKLLPRARKISQAQTTGTPGQRGGLEDSLPLTSARCQHLVVEIRHQLLGDWPAASHRSKQYESTRFIRAAGSSQNHVRSGTCASGRPPNHAREDLKPLNYPGCKQRRPGAQAAEPRRAGAEQAAEFISLSHAAAMSRSPGSNHGFYHKTRKTLMSQNDKDLQQPT